MTTETEKRNLTSIAGRSWLKKASSSKGSLELPSDKADGGQPTGGSHLSFAQEGDDVPQVETLSVEIPDVTLTEVASASGVNLQSIHPDDIATAIATVEPVSDQSEKASDWSVATKPQSKPRQKPEVQPVPKKDAEKNGSVDQLCAAILERFPIAQPAVLMFAGSEPNIHVDETSARVASLLASKNVGRVLLVDSDLSTRALTQASGLMDEQGLCNVKDSGVDWKPLVFGGSATNLDFLPAGTRDRFLHEIPNDSLINAVAEAKLDYQFILVSVGDAHAASARVWSEICDGSYLLVSMKKSNETIAQSAVAQLKNHGARLLGCVVTDAV